MVTHEVARTLNPMACSLLEACEKDARPYEPRLDVTESDTGFWIRDHERPIAYVHRRWYTLDAFEFSPFRSLGREPKVSPRYDMGTYINMHATLFQAIGGNFNWPSLGCQIRWRTDDPRELRLEIHGEYASGEVTDNVLTVGYDPQSGQYLYRLHDRLRMPEQRRQEFCNVYPKDLGNGMPSGKKWQYTVWTGADGRLWKMPHTPALTCLMRTWGDGRVKMIAPQGFIGWGVEEDFNLVAVFERASVPIVSGTCDMWFDEHLSFEKPGMECLDGNVATAEVAFRLLNAPADFMRRAIGEARSLSFSQEEIAGRGGPAFIPEQVNDLEEPLDPHVPQAGQAWRVADPHPGSLEMEDAARRHIGKLGAQRHVAWADDCGHSGRRSIRLLGLPDRILRFGPVGHDVHVEAGATYRFEGWIKTQGARGRLWIGRCWYDWKTFYGEAESPSVEPDSDWTHVAVEITNEDYPYILCRLVVEGEGYAWFDDLYWHRVR